MSDLWLGYKVSFCRKKQTKKIRAANEQAWQCDEREEEATKDRVKKKKDKPIDTFKLFLHRGINTLHEFSCKRNAVCLYIMLCTQP